MFTAKIKNSNAYAKYVEGRGDYNYWTLTTDAAEAFKFKSEKDFKRIEYAIKTDTRSSNETFELISADADTRARRGEFSQPSLFESLVIEALNEAEAGESTSISIKKATISDRKKGESYVVYDTTTKKVVTYNSKRMHMLKRETAKAVADTEENWKTASSAWAHDKGIN